MSQIVPPLENHYTGLTNGSVLKVTNNKVVVATPNTDYVIPASPALTGTPTAPTPGTSDNSTTIATTAFVKGQGYSASQVYQTGLLAEYRFDDGTGTVLKDYSGNGNDGTLQGTVLPTWSPLGLTFVAGQLCRVDLPTGVLPTMQTVMVFSSSNTKGNSVSSGRYSALFSNTSSANLQLLSSSSGNVIANPCTYTGGTFTTQSSEAINGPSCLSLVIDGSNTNVDKIYIDHEEVAGYVLGAASKSASNRTGTPCLGGGNNATDSLPGTIYYALIYSTQLTAQQIAQNVTVMKSVLQKRGVIFNPTSTSTTNNYIAIGDSITAGQGVSNAYPSLVTLNEAFTTKNLGIGGLNAYSTQFLAKNALASYYNPRASRNICSVLIGTNDIAVGHSTGQMTPVQTFGFIVNTCLAARAAGYKVVVGTILSRSLGNDAPIGELNCMIRNGWSRFADALADFADNPLLGAVGAYANATNFPDGIHPNQTMHNMMAVILSTAINSLLTVPQQRIYNTSAVTVASTNSETTSLGTLTSDIRRDGTLATSTTVTVLATTNDLLVGMTVTGNNIPANTTIASITNSTTIVLSAAATGSGITNLTFGRIALPAYSLTLGKTYSLSQNGILSTFTSGTLNIKFKLGSTVLGTTSAMTLTASLSNVPWRLDARVTTVGTGASGQLWVQGEFLYQPTTGSAWTVFPINSTAVVNVDTTVPYLVDVTDTWSVNNASNSKTTTNFSLLGL